MVFDPRNPSGEKRTENRIPAPTVTNIKGHEESVNQSVNSVDEPVLMPKQDQPFNGDHFVAEEFLKLKEKFKVDRAIELGTCVGGTTKWLGENFDVVQTIEINGTFQDFAKQRCNRLTNIDFYLGSTVDKLAEVLACEGWKSELIFIDSHWNTLPIFDELKIIKASGLKPVIAIHDFLVPNEPKLGFDSYEGVDISFVNIKSYIDDIYGEDGYDYHYNTDATSTEIKRGLIFIYPKA